MKVLEALSAFGAIMLAATPLAAAGAAHAQDIPSVSIRVGDLDFASRADVARFNDRVARAGDQMCNNLGPDAASLTGCLSAVREEAVSKLSPQQRTEMAAARGASPAWRFAAN